MSSCVFSLFSILKVYLVVYSVLLIYVHNCCSRMWLFIQLFHIFFSGSIFDIIFSGLFATWYCYQISILLFSDKDVCCNIILGYECLQIFEHFLLREKHGLNLFWRLVLFFKDHKLIFVWKMPSSFSFFELKLWWGNIIFLTSLFNLNVTWVLRLRQESQMYQKKAFLEQKEKQVETTTKKNKQILNTRKT